MNPIHKAKMLKHIREKGMWKGFIAPSNVNSFHIAGGCGWHLGCPVEIKIVDGQYFVVREDELMELESFIANFSHYNCNAELGRRVRFWEKVS